MISTVTRRAQTRSPPPLNPFSRANPAASAHSTLPAVFAIHSRELGEPYSAHSLVCGFSRGTKRGRFDFSLHNPARCVGHNGFGTSQQSRRISSVLPDSTGGCCVFQHRIVKSLPSACGNVAIVFHRPRQSAKSPDLHPLTNSLRYAAVPAGAQRRRIASLICRHFCISTSFNTSPRAWAST
jgi:hypothetical protein